MKLIFNLHTLLYVAACHIVGPASVVMLSCLQGLATLMASTLLTAHISIGCHGHIPLHNEAQRLQWHYQAVSHYIP